MFNRRDVKPDLEQMGFRNLAAIYWNASTPHLYEEIVRRREGNIAHLGPIVVRTGHHMGRSPKDRFIVEEPTSRERIWWSANNRGISEAAFTSIFYRLLAYLQNKDIFVQDCYAGAHPGLRIPIRIITEKAWHNLFARNMFIQMRTYEEIPDHHPEFTVIDVPKFHAIPELDGLESEAFILLHLGRKLVLIGGTSYAGEIKKSVFTMLNYFYPARGILPMHCSANVGPAHDAAIFFGLSGTGKTSLSASPDRILIGDDEHGWGPEGIFNFEGGCYAKVIRLSKTAEPEIYETTRRFGTILENVYLDQNSRRLDLNDEGLTENTRAAYPISHIPSACRDGACGHPRHIVMLTFDAFGVLPPVARLSTAQAVYHFLSGYTAKVAGTEIGVKEPQATFSACFGAPFMALPPVVYADLLMERILEHKVRCWLVNTGWIGEPYGRGERISIGYSRAIVRAILEGRLDEVAYAQDPVFGFGLPAACPGIPEKTLNPARHAADPAEYARRALKLRTRFQANFQTFADQVPPSVLAEAL